MDETRDVTPPGQPMSPGFPSGAGGTPTSGYSAVRLSGERFAPGVVLAGRYRLVSRLGVGGMGEVYRADDLTLGTSVALKFLPATTTGDPLRRQKLLDEVRVAREVTHPNVCRVFDIGDYEGQLFISMEYVDGEDLSSLLRRIGRFPEDRAAEIGRQICFGLAAAHEKGILHRDLKPANVMLDGRGKIRITDFGLAALAETLHAEEIRAGTPAYMSPEQRKGEGLTARSDIYSLGLVLHEVFTGKSALTGDTVTALNRSASATTSRLTTNLTGISPDVERVIGRCLELDPDDRPGSAIAVATMLPGGDALAAAIAAGELPSPKLVAESGGRGRMTRAVAGCLLALFLVGMILRTWAYEYMGAHRLAKLEKSPEVLVSRARELAKKYAPEYQLKDWTSSLAWRSGFLGHLYRTEGTLASLSRVSTEFPATVRLFYRQAPDAIVPVPISDLVNETAPPPELGDVQVELTMGGHLAAYRAQPYATFAPAATRPASRPTPSPASGPSEDDGPVEPVDFREVFADAGLDLARFAPATPALLTPGVPADERLAWVGKLPGPEPFPVRVEVGRQSGRLAYFEVCEPWDLPRDLRAEMGYVTPAAPQANRFEETLRAVVTHGREAGFLLMVVLYSASFAMAFANIGKRRGDLRGGWRLALFVFACLCFGWLLGVHHPLSPVFFNHLMSGMGKPLVQALYVFAMYLALEPYIRARWPERLVSWSRLMDGRFRDTMVARDVLVGLAGGAALYFAVQGCLTFAPLLGYRISAATIGTADELSSLPRALGYTTSALCSTLLRSLMSVFLLALLKTYLKRTWVAVAIFVPLWATTLLSEYGLTGAILQIGSVLAYAGVMALLIVRLGLLSNAVALTALTLLLTLPSTTSIESWWWPTFAVLGGTYVAVAVASYRRATA